LLFVNIYQIGLWNHKIILAQVTVVTIEELAVELHSVRLAGEMIDDALVVFEVLVKKIKLLGGATVENLVELVANLAHRLIQILARVATELETALGGLGQRMGRLDLNQIGRIVETNVHHTATFAVEIVVETFLVGESREDAFKGLAHVDATPIGAIENVFDLGDRAGHHLVGGLNEVLEGGVH
jgi:hypothetical protein